MTPYTEERWSRYFSLTIPPEETVAARMMLYKNTKVNVRSPDGDKLFLHCSKCATRRYISLIPVYYLPRLRSSNIYRFTERKNGFTLAKERYPVQTITDANYVDNIALLPNTSALAESLQHSLEKAAGGVGLHVNADKTEHMCVNQRGDISTLNDCPLKLVHNLTYLGSNVTLTENYINTQLAKAWTANNSLPVTWKSDFSDKIIRIFSQALVV